MKLKQKQITGSTLKIIAMAAMFLDHIASAVLLRMLVLRGIMELATPESYVAFFAENAGLYYPYLMLKIIGRIAFPIFCYLLVEGFLHTHDVKKYAGRLFLFALISEVPFDLAFSGEAFAWDYQNVYFTLLFGLIAIAAMHFAEEQKTWHKAVKVICYIAAVAVCGGAVLFLHTDYDVMGVLVIVAIYLFRRNKMLSAAAGCAVLADIPAFFSLLPIYLYNGERGKNIKWLFYAFYPVHILLLYGVACAMGLGGVVI